MRAASPFNTFVTKSFGHETEIEDFILRMEKSRPKQGFASMSSEKRQEVASKGGTASAKSEKHHDLTLDLQQAGGKISSANKEEMAVRGRGGGKATHANGNAYVITQEDRENSGKSRRKTKPEV